MSDFPDYVYEDRVKEKGYKYIVGVDEVGRGALCSSVVAAAVRIPDYIIPTLMGKVKDSKKLSAKKREELYKIITETCDWSIGEINNKIIDEINILEATKLAMRQAVNGIKFVDYVLVDGNFEIPGLGISQRSIISGDNLSISISCASIVAKVNRDEIMRTLHWVYPQYGFLNNKGYGTEVHIQAIREYGATEFHRRSFSGVKEYVK